MNQQNAVVFESLSIKQSTLLQELTQLQNELLKLQEIIQQKVSGRLNVKFTNLDVSSAPDFNGITRRDSQQPVTPIINNELFPIDGSNQLPVVPPVVQQQPHIQAFDELESLPCKSSISDIGFCRPLVRCSAFYADIPELRKQPCILREGQFGVCCPFRDPKSKFFHHFGLR